MVRLRGEIISAGGQQVKAEQSFLEAMTLAQ
jgi:hypothetical protein